MAIDSGCKEINTGCRPFLNYFFENVGVQLPFCIVMLRPTFCICSRILMAWKVSSTKPDFFLIALFPNFSGNIIAQFLSASHIIYVGNGSGIINFHHDMYFFFLGA